MKDLGRAIAALRVDGKGKGKFRLGDCGTDATAGVKDKREARKKLAETVARMNALQMKWYAEARRGLLVVLQAMDTGGKDGTIRRVFGPLNPQGVGVTCFKRPSLEEAGHDYLWRVHPHVPAKGMIRVFNRSHFEDVLVHRVHKLLPADALERRYRQINDFERYLAENGVVILKFFLHISKGEQKRRLEARLRNPDKRWKFELGDLKERGFWDRYVDAYQAVVEKCSAPHAPWYVVPADNKWYRDLVVAEVVAGTLEALAPSFPKEAEGLDDVKVE